jgi:GTP cyclohydrolase III
MPDRSVQAASPQLENCGPWRVTPQASGAHDGCVRFIRFDGSVPGVGIGATVHDAGFGAEHALGECRADGSRRARPRRRERGLR